MPIVALGGALLLDRLHFRGLVSPFLLALAVAAWYGGTGPAVLALLVSCISFAYLTEAEQLSHTGSFGWDVSSGKTYRSQETFRIFEYDPPTEPTLELVMPDGTVKYLRVVGRPSNDASGNFEFVGTVTDITER